MYYITNLEDLAPQVAIRQAKSKEIRMKINQWVYNEYGISEFSELAQQYFGFTNGRTNLVLLRQIPSVRIEDISCHIGARVLGYPLMSFPFLDDTFSSHNHEKRSYLNPVWHGHGRNGPYIQGQKLVNQELGNYVGMRLGSISTSPKIPGDYLHEFHFSLRRRLFGENDTLFDVSELHRSTVRKASNRPKEVYSFENGLSKRANTQEVNLSGNAFRPPSEWYYPLMFCWFMDGTAVLLETYDNDLAQVSLAKELFENTMQKLIAGTGISPLILKVPPLDKNMLYLAKSIVENPHALGEIEQKFAGKTEGNSVQFFSEIAEAILAWQK